MAADTYISGEQWLGLNIFFYVLLPSLIIMGIWYIVRDLKRDEEWERSGESFANDFISHAPCDPHDPPRFPGWRESKGRLVEHWEKYGPK